MIREPRQVVPTVLTPITLPIKSFRLTYLEVANDSGEDATFRAEDAAGLAIIPTQTIKAGAILTYICKIGMVITGFSWVAGTHGLIGWFCGGSDDESL